MKTMNVFHLFISLLTASRTLKAVEWGYNSNIVQNLWGTIFPQCNGREQSPIDFQRNKVNVDLSLQPFDLRQLYNTNRVKMVLSNNGHSIHLDLTEKKLEVNGGNLPGSYMAEQLHFHWGSRNKQGSEHLCNGKAYPMEMHIVTHSKQFKNVAEALGISNGLAVLGFWFKIGRYNKLFEPIVSKLRYLTRKGSKIELKKVFRLGNLLPSTKHYYRYQGSLTTPPCSEGVIWTMFQGPIYLSRAQMEEFRKLGRTCFPEAVDLSNNFRKLQRLYGRVVTTNSRRFSRMQCCQ